MADEATLSAAQFSFDQELTLDDIDDQEYNIPTLDELPTLESILSEVESDDDLLIDDHHILDTGVRGAVSSGGGWTMKGTPTSSLCDEPIGHGTPPNSERYSMHGNLLQQQAYSSSQGSLESINMSNVDMGAQRSHDMKRYERQIGPSPHGSVVRHAVLKRASTQLASAVDRIDAGMATAMSVGRVIVVGMSHGTALVFNSNQTLKYCLGNPGSEYGAVSALAVGTDSTRLLVGFAKGQITMWDLTSGKLIRTITDAQPPGYGVIQLAFTDDSALAYCSNSGGSVFELSFKRLIGVRTCDSRCLFSGSRGEVCAFEPLLVSRGNVKDHPLSRMTILALATLTKVIIVITKPKVKVLFAYPLNGTPESLPLLCWQFVVIQTSTENRIVDPVLAFARDQKINFFQLDTQNVDSIKFVQLQSIDFPYSLIGMSWLNSRTLLTVDTHEKVHVVDIRTDDELEFIGLDQVELVYGTSHFKSVATGGNVSKAFETAAGQACYGSMVTQGNQLLLLGKKAIHTLSLRTWEERIRYLIKQEKHRDAINLALSFYEGNAKAVVGLTGSVSKRRQDISDLVIEVLFSFVERTRTHCPDHGSLHTLLSFYEGLVPLCIDTCLTLARSDILFDRVYPLFCTDPVANSVFLESLTPYILSDRLRFVTPLIMRDLIENYESKGLLEYVEECIPHLDILSLDIHQVVTLCWKYGLYDGIIYLFNQGMGDFLTPLEEMVRHLESAMKPGKPLSRIEMKLGNKLLVYISCGLTGLRYSGGDLPYEQATKVGKDFLEYILCYNGKERKRDWQAYPHLRTLLHFNTREFLNVLAIAFDESLSSVGFQSKQVLVNTLLVVMVESVGFTPHEIGSLFTFLARQVAKESNTIRIDQTVFDQVLEYLTSNSENSMPEEREQALLELMNSGALVNYNEDLLLTMAEGAKFHRVCELIYGRQRKFDKIICCYCKDELRKRDIFTFIANVAKLCSDEERQAVLKQVMSSLEDIIAIDCQKSAEMALFDLNLNLNDVTIRLKPRPETLFHFLTGVLEARESRLSFTNKDIEAPHPQLIEMYIDLMCGYDPESVTKFLQTNDLYRLEETTLICRKRGIKDAVAFLLEKAGNVRGAFEIIHNLVKENMKRLSQDEQTDRSQRDKRSRNLETAVEFCQRNSKKVEDQEMETMWFSLLDTVVAPQRSTRSDLDPSDIVSESKEYMKHVLSSMMGFVRLPTILQKIMQDTAYTTGQFGEVKDLISSMLSTCKYEETLLTIMNNLMTNDTFWSFSNLHSALRRGVTSEDGRCCICSKHNSASTQTDGVVIFTCGHSYHERCLGSVGYFTVGEGGADTIWSCYLCTCGMQGGVDHPGLTPDGEPPTPSTSTDPPLPRVKKQPKELVQLSEMQIQALTILRDTQRPPSAAAAASVRGSNARTTPRPWDESTQKPGGKNSILSHETFKLRLAPSRNELAS